MLHASSPIRFVRFNHFPSSACTLLRHGCQRSMTTVVKETEDKDASARKPTAFHGTVTADGSSGFPAQAGRYHLYVSHVCPWAHRTMIMRSLKGLDDAISFSVVDWKFGEGGWKFTSEFPDHVEGKSFLSELYFATQPDYAGKYSVPVLYDKETKKIVNNESSEIIRMLNSEFNAFSKTPAQSAHDFYPESLRPEIDSINQWIFDQFNTGVYRAGFASTQDAYDKAFNEVFDALDRIEAILTKKRYLLGDKLTEADVRLFPTLIRFDAVYFHLYMCNRDRVSDFPALRGYLSELYQMPEIKHTVDFFQIRQANYLKTGIVPGGPSLRYLDQPHGRDAI